jgi:demethylmenaquinone methyltransferase/2-methoxy-6-polyprenyl-1,4-benzoquinol methylase
MAGERLRGVIAAAPDPLLARERYRALAGDYDVRTVAGQPYRRRTVQRLAAQPGEVILDVGCGTGLNFCQLEAGIGPNGRLIGIDLSPEMLTRARARIERHGWSNVELVQSDAEHARLRVRGADAALLCGVHDVMRSPAALENVLGHLRHRGRVVAGGPKWAPWSRPDGAALNLLTWSVNRGYVTTFEGFDEPWSHLASLVTDLEVEVVYFGGGYIAAGRWRRGRPPARHRLRP